MRRIKERLDRLCSPVPESGCWLWSAATTPGGYGKITVRTGVTEYAHRVSWITHFGEIPDGKYVCHKCDTPQCINPDHLFLGTPHENNMDAVKKGRNARGVRSPASRLSEGQVVSIFESTKTCRELAEFYGISASLVSCIRTRKRWKHITENQEAA